MFSDVSIHEYEFCEVEDGQVGISLMIGDYGGCVEVIITKHELENALKFVKDSE